MGGKQASPTQHALDPHRKCAKQRANSKNAQHRDIFVSPDSIALRSLRSHPPTSLQGHYGSAEVE